MSAGRLPTCIRCGQAMPPIGRRCCPEIEVTAAGLAINRVPVDKPRLSCLLKAADGLLIEEAVRRLTCHRGDPKRCMNLVAGRQCLLDATHEGQCLFRVSAARDPKIDPAVGDVVASGKVRREVISLLNGSVRFKVSFWSLRPGRNGTRHLLSERKLWTKQRAWRSWCRKGSIVMHTGGPA